jgi:hypothetical protein
VRSADINLEVDGLAGGVRVNVIRVVGELVALAQPDIALSGVVVALASGNLQLALDIAVVVGLLVDLDLVAAGGLHSGAGHTGIGAGHEAVAVDEREQGREGSSGSGERLHLDSRCGNFGLSVCCKDRERME